MKKLVFWLLFVVLANGCRAQRNAFPLKEGWKFTRSDSPDHASPAADDSDWEYVRIPHDWAIAGPFDMTIDAQRVTVREDGEVRPSLRTGRSGALPWIGTGWYRKRLPASLTPAGRRYTLEFDGAMSNARIFVNGKYAGGWAYGYTSFEVDITDLLDYGRENLIAVRLENKPQSSRWYPGAGIYRNVRLVSTGKVYIPMWGTRIVTELTDRHAAIRIRTEVYDRGGGCSTIGLTTEIRDREGRLVATSSTKGTAADQNRFDQTVYIPEPQLWDTEQPCLYTAVSRVEAGGRLTDTYTTTFGIRTVAFDPDAGLLLNGQRVEIRGVCLHHDLGPLGAAVNRRALERQLEILKEMGCNAIRTSHNPPAPELLDLCDRMGFMVMDEIFDEWKIAKNKNGYATLFDEWAERDLTALIRRDRNHPSVIIWSIGNEIREQADPNGAQVARFLADICRREDPTRPVTAGLNDWENALKNGFADVLDIIGFNYKPFAYAPVHGAYPEKSLLGAETASTVSSRGIYHLPAEEVRLTEGVSLWPDCQCSSYDLVYPRWASTPDTEFEAQEDYGFVAGEFVWTGFDYLGEPTPYNDTSPARSSYFGILDLAGMKKDRFYLYQSRWSDRPVLHLLPHWNWEGFEGEEIPVHCYTNYERAELFLNGRSMGCRSKSSREKKNRFRLVWEGVPYEDGELKVVAYDTAGKIAAESRRITAGPAARIVLTADRDPIAADGDDLSFVEATLTDADGNPCPKAVSELEFNVSGEGTLEALCNGDPTSHLSFRSRTMPAFSGKCVAVIRSTRRAGLLTLTVSSPGLPDARLNIRTEP